jgi:1,4-dihydroxy-2-naphthoate octaprenyltransferase
LIARAIRRGRSESQKRAAVSAVALIALALWVGASWLMMIVDFGMAMGLAHSKGPLPSGYFPEGWPIYLVTAGYAVLGYGLFALIGKLPRTKTIA